MEQGLIANDPHNRLFPCDLQSSTAAHDAIDIFKLLVRIGGGRAAVQSTYLGERRCIQWIL
jgi:hypothetical protein